MINSVQPTRYTARLMPAVRHLTVQDTPEYCVGEVRIRYTFVPWQSSMTFAQRL